MFVMMYSYCSVSQTTEHGGPIDGRHETYVTSKYHSVNVLVSRPTFCVLLKKYMLLTHDRVCLFTADKCKTLLEVSYFDSVLYFCFNSFPVYAICLEIETNVSTDRAILNMLRHHSENDVFTTYIQHRHHKHREVIKTVLWKHCTQDCVNNVGTVAQCVATACAHDKFIDQVIS